MLAWGSLPGKLYMVYISSFIAIFFGTILGLIFVFTKQGKIAKGLSPVINFIIGLIVNIVRSIPFIILLIAIIPFTRWLLALLLAQMRLYR